MLSRVFISGRLEGLFALLPVARAQLIGLQRIEDAQHFLRASADIKVGDVHEAHDALRIDDEGGTLRNPGLGIENTQCAGELALDVREHRKGERAQLLLLTPPGEVHVLTVDAHTEQLRIARAELALELAERGNLGGADEGKVLRPEEHHLPLTGEAFVGKGLERATGVVRYDAGECEFGETTTDS